jgi:1-acyl-sn-glycerol-3-phosphate acyltransferase
MPPWALTTVTVLLLVVPWLVWPPHRHRPEIRGFLRILWWLNLFYCTVWHRLRTNGLAPLPDEGPAILIANHTCGIDHLLLQAGCRRVLGFLIAKEYYEHSLIHPLCKLLRCIPVRRDGRDVAATRTALRALAEGRVLPIFPEGTITATSGRELGKGKPGVAFIALHARVPIVPAYISGTPETNDIGRALWTPSNARVVFGRPIDLSDIPDGATNDKATLAAVTARLMAAIAELRAELVAEQEQGLSPSERPSGRADDPPRAEPLCVTLSGEPSAARSG